MSVKSLYYFIGLFSIIIKGDTCSLTDSYVYYEELDISYKFVVQAMQWRDARDYCFGENATLAIPKTEAERNVLKNIFSEYPANKIINPSHNNYIHLGFHDTYEENEFLSISDYSIEYYFRDLELGQPNGGRGENSLAMERNGRYHDYPNNDRCAFICQKDHSNYDRKLLARLKSYSDPGYILDPVSQKRFKFHSDPRKWSVARTICFAEGGNLAIIRNRHEENFITSMLASPKNTDIRYTHLTGFAWLGLHDMIVEGRFESVTGETLKNIGYIRWLPGQPYGGVGESCVIIDTNGLTHDVNCDLLLAYFCEIAPDNKTNSSDYHLSENYLL